MPGSWASVFWDDSVGGTKEEGWVELADLGQYKEPRSTRSFVLLPSSASQLLQQDHRDTMRNMLLRMMGVLMCALAACADIPPAADFSLEKMAGKWFNVGFATNAQWFVNHKDSMKMGTAIITPTEGGDMDLSYSSLNSDGTCWRMTHLAKKTETPGRFTFHSQRWNNDNDMRIVDAVYDNYALVHTVKTKDGVSEVLNKLYSRTTEASADLQLKFTQFSLGTGILADNIVMLPQNAECPAV